MPPFMILFLWFWQNRDTFKKTDGPGPFTKKKKEIFCCSHWHKWAINTKLWLKDTAWLCAQSCVCAFVHSLNDEFAWNQTPPLTKFNRSIFMIAFCCCFFLHRLQFYSDSWYQILWFLSICMSVCVSEFHFGDEVTDFQNIIFAFTYRPRTRESNDQIGKAHWKPLAYRKL